MRARLWELLGLGAEGSGLAVAAQTKGWGSLSPPGSHRRPLTALRLSDCKVNLRVG